MSFDSATPDIGQAQPPAFDAMSNRTHHVQVTAAWRAEIDRRQFRLDEF
jgi:hypothetical protein